MPARGRAGTGRPCRGWTAADGPARWHGLADAHRPGSNETPTGGPWPWPRTPPRAHRAPPGGRVAALITQAFDDRNAVLGQLHRGQVFEAQAQHPDAQLVVGAVTDALDKPHLLHCLWYGEHRGARHIEAARQFGAGELGLLAGEAAQQLQAPGQARDEVAVACVVHVLVLLVSRSVFRGWPAAGH